MIPIHTFMFSYDLVTQILDYTVTQWTCHLGRCFSIAFFMRPCVMSPVAAELHTVGLFRHS